MALLLPEEEESTSEAGEEEEKEQSEDHLKECIANFVALLAVTLIILGELLREENFRGLLMFGVILGTWNAMEASGLYERTKDTFPNLLATERNTIREVCKKPTVKRVHYSQESVSIPIEPSNSVRKSRDGSGRGKEGRRRSTRRKVKFESAPLRSETDRRYRTFEERAESRKSDVQRKIDVDDEKETVYAAKENIKSGSRDRMERKERKKRGEKKDKVRREVKEKGRVHGRGSSTIIQL